MKDKKLSRKKHKRLDAIYERESSRSRREVEVIEASDCKDGGDEVDLRRSSRARKAPVLLDTSPSPAKKRRKTGKGSGLSNVEHGKGEDGINIELDGYDSRDAEVGDDGWRARLRSRGRGGGFKVRGLEVSSPRGKRKLFEHSDLMNEESVSVDGDVEKQKPEVVGVGTTVVKSKRPGRVKASNFLGNQSPEIELGGSADDDQEESVEREVLEVKVQGDQSIVCGIECDIDNNGDDGNTPPPSVEIIEGETKVDIQLEKCPGPSDMSNSAIEASVQLEDCQRLYQLEDAGQYIQAEVGTCSVGGDLSNAVKNNESNGDCNKDKGDSDKPLETQTFKKLRKKHYHSDDKHEKVQIKEGRRCGLCGTGSDGRPPKKLVQDGAGSDNEAYSGSSSAEEPNYDMLDGFGDEPGWVGRLLGPINDRHGIAGIFVHQQCAVWSPEVYFAGLGCLKNVRAALCRGRVLKCTRCGRPGATIGCRVDRCPRTYHLPCARANNCIFDHRKFLIACTDHRYLFQPHGNQNGNYLKKLERKKIKLELRKNSNDACRKDVEAEEKWLENCGEDEEFLKRESKRLHRDLLRIAPTYIGGSSGKQDAKIEGWESVAGLQSVIQCLKEVVILPLLYPEYFENLGLMPPRGVLLHGYPGTGKTLVVRALIGSCARGDKKIAYFARKGADCLGKYVGDAERQLRLLFQVAEKSQPSIIFFDEIDGLAPCRTPQQDQTHSSVVSTLLALMDGLKSRGSVIVIGATNRPDAIDPALRRPGRFDREIYFPLPSVDDREAILSLHTRNWPKPISGSILKRIARKTVGFAGADIQALCTQAAIIALRRSFPLQRILSEAADKAINGQRPPLPFVVVQERDWLEAFSCAAPPCSRREVGCASNELLSSPLPMYLESCLLQPLSRMLISLYLDERVWLPRPLSKAASCIEKVIVAALGKRKVNRDNWWSHATDMLEEAHIRSQIEDGLRNVGIIEGGTCSSSYAILEDNGDGRPEMELSGMQCARPWLLHNASYASSKKSGFRLLISGNPKSGQRHLASCLLHYFLGNVEVQKIDLAAISHQGHGDVVQGLQQVLMRCASLHYSMIFMPRIDLWAMEIFNQEQHSPSTELGSSQGTSSNGFLSVDKMDGNPNNEGVDAVTKPSYLWNLFVEQVESISINSSLTVLATSEVHLSKLPHRIQQFFNVERINDKLLTSMGNSVPRFSVEVDGSFEFDSVFELCSVRLSKDLAQHFAQFMHYGNHIHVASFSKDNVSYADQPGVGGLDNVTETKQFPATTVSPASQINISVKGKSSLLVAIHTFGSQILLYPHFAELCWVTSKLKEGPSASIDGPWKGWPFNSCIVRSAKLSERNTAPSVNNAMKINEKSSIVRGLIAVGLSAYRGEYMSLKQVASEVRKVLELLVGLIDAKIQAGKDRHEYIRVTSQVAYLEDMVLNWAHTLQRFEADAQPNEADLNTIHVSSLNNVSSIKSCPPEGEVTLQDATNVLLHESTVPEETLHELDANGVESMSHAKTSPEHVLDTGKEPLPEINANGVGGMSHPKSSPEHVLGADKETSPKIDAPLSKEDKLHALDNLIPVDHTEYVVGGQAELHLGHATEESKNDEEAAIESEPSRHSSGSAEFHSVRPTDNELRCSGDRCSTQSCTCHAGAEASVVENNVPPENTVQDLNTHSLHSCHTSTSTPVPQPDIICIYSCCSKCFASLQCYVREVLSQWSGTETDSTMEDVHDFVSRISSNLHSAIRRLPMPEKSCFPTDEKTLEEGENTKCCHTRQPSSESHNLTSAHVASGTRAAPSELELEFIFRNGVLTTSDTSCDDASFHCKWETLCLCSLVEWIRSNKERLVC